MAEVQPFRGWRYDLAQVGGLSEVTAPPYDVIGPQEQLNLYQKHPCNVIRLILNRQEPGDSGPGERYRRAANFLRHWRTEGTLWQEREDALYVYHQRFEWERTTYVRRGFLGRLRLEEFGRGNVYPHEETMSGPKADRLALTKACRMNLSPIFGLYPDEGSVVQSRLEEVIRSITPVEATDDLGVVHRLWPVSNRDALRQVRELLKERPIFIADGHHRYETALNYRSWLRSEGKLSDDVAAANFVLMHFVGMHDPGLAILPTHRLISGLPPLTADDVKAVLGSDFQFEDMGLGVEAAYATWEMMQADGGQNVFGFGTGDARWLLARLTDETPMRDLASEKSDDWRRLGVSVLEQLVLNHLLAEQFPDAERICRYVHLLDEVTSAQREKSCQLACLVAPAGTGDVRRIASKYERMPPKSTYFYPKLLSGLVFNSLE